MKIAPTSNSFEQLSPIFTTWPGRDGLKLWRS